MDNKNIENLTNLKNENMMDKEEKSALILLTFTLCGIVIILSQLL